MRGLSKILFFLLFFLESQLSGQNLPNEAFFIAPENKDITYFKINLKPTNPDIRTIILLRERQIFMTLDENSQAIALLEDISLETTGDSVIKEIGTGVCINPRTPVNADSLRYNPGETVVSFVAQNKYDNQDWERAKAYFKKNKGNLPPDKYYEITIFWEIQPGDTTGSVLVSVIFNGASERIVKKLINEELSVFKYEREESRIRKEVIRRFGKAREESLYFAQWIGGPVKLEKRYDYRVAFRVW